MVDWHERIERMRAALEAAGGAPTETSWGYVADRDTQPMEVRVSELDVLIADAMEREQRAAEWRAAEWRANLLELLDAALSEELRAALNLTIQATRSGAWAEFTYADRRFDLQRTGAGSADMLCLKLPGENGLLQIGQVHPSIGKLDEALLRSLGHWRERHGIEEPAEKAPEEAPF